MVLMLDGVSKKPPMVTMIPGNTFVVAPLNTISPIDVQKSVFNIDNWLKQIHPYLSLQALAQVAGMIPVVGNIIALVDTVESVISLVDKENPDVLDWVDLCINLIGVLPFPPNMAAARMSLRPMVMSARNTIRSGKTTLSAALEQVITASLNDQVAGQLGTFVDGAQNQLDQLVNECANYSSKLSGDLGNALINIGNGTIINTKASQAINQDAQKQFQQITTANFIRDPNKTIANFFNAIGQASSTGLYAIANATATNLLKNLSIEAKQFLIQMGQKIKAIGVKASSSIKAHAKKNLLQFLNILKSVLAKRSKSAAVKPNSITQSKNVKAAISAEGKTKLEKPIKNPNPCNCGGTTATKKSISFSLGTEFITHLDAEISYAQGYIHQRSYASNLNCYDQSEFGARWLTPWTTKIFIEGKELRYVDETGRTIHLPILSTNTTYFVVSEGLYITYLEDNLVIEYLNKDKYVFEKYNDYYLLKAISRENQTQAVMQHQLGILKEIKFYNRENLDFSIECLINSNNKIGQLLLHKNNQIEEIASYLYNNQGDLVEVTNRDGAKYSYEYKNHLVTRYTDLTNRAINLEWDSEDYTARAVHEWADDGSQEYFLQWIDDKRCTLVIDSDQNTTQYHYDINGYNYRVVYPDESEEWFIRDQNSKVTQYFTTTGEVFIYRYSERGELLESISPDGSSIQYVYKDGNPVEIKNAEGAIWINEYNNQDQLVKEIDPLKHETSYSYNAIGLVTSIKDANGGSKTLKYDDQGNLISYTDCSGKETQWKYDGRGRIKSIENALKQKVEYFYTDKDNLDNQKVFKGMHVNAAGQLEKIKFADNTEEYFIHDAEGRLLRHQDVLGQQTSYEYNNSGLISKRIDASNQVLKYQWDKLSRLKRLINENGAVYEFFYDEMGRLLKEIDFDSKETIYKYDERTKQLTTCIEVASRYGQNIADHIAPKDRIQQFLFDSMGRLEQRTAGYGQVGMALEQEQHEIFAYDGNGQLVLAKNSIAEIHWFYDAVGNQVHEHQHNLILKKTAVWKYSYDAINDRIQTIRPDGQKLDWLTYGSGHVLGLAVNGEDLVGFERDDLHREILRHYHNGVSHQQQYDTVGRLAEQQIVRGHDQGYQMALEPQINTLNKTKQLVTRLYQYDKTGQLTQIKDSRRGNIFYKYDPVGRLLEASSQIGKETFSFDPASNILDKYDHATDIQSKQNSEVHSRYNRLVGNVVKEYLDQQYQYDSFGQLIKQKSTKGDLNLEWDVFGRLIKSRNTEYTVEYHYDALGRRIQKRSKHHHSGHEQETVYGWDGDTLAYESTEQSTKHYIYEKDSFIPLLQASYVGSISLHHTPDWTSHKYNFYGDPLWKVTKKSKGFDNIWFYHCDHLGTPQEMSDETGAIVWAAEYKAWGERVSAKPSKSDFFESSEIITNNIRFQGQYFDEETGLHYNRYRYYSPYVGRFISKDPIGLLGGNNRYMYVPTPTTWVDVLGLSSCQILKAPNPRHYADKVTQKSTAKEKNTVMNRKVVDVNSDVNAIRSGLATKIANTFTLKNGHIYGEHDCVLYPISGSGFYTLSRGEYKALGHFNVLGEKKGEEILNKAGYNKEAIEKGKEIWKIIK